MPMSKDFKKRLFPLLPEMVKEFPTPIHVFDEVGIREKLSELKVQTMDVEGFMEFFAVKAAPYPAILRIVQEVGYGADCSSISELILARAAGFSPDRIMFTSNNTTTEAFERALGDGGSIINLDDTSFLNHPIFAKEGRMPETICFRINPGDLRQDESVIGKPVKAKYGIMVSQIQKAYKKAQSLGAKKFGIHTMICSNDLKFANLRTTLMMLCDFVTELHDQADIQCSFMNIGGGIGIPYKLGDTKFDLNALTTWMKRIQAGLAKDLGFTTAIHLESGRAITGPYGVFVARVINHKYIYETHVGVDGAMIGNPRPAIYDAYHEMSIVDSDGQECTKYNRTVTKVVNVVGPICENCDQTATARELPATHIGDFAVSHDCGAHAAPMASNYNGHPRPGAVMLKEDETFVLIQHPETIDILLARTKGL